MPRKQTTNLSSMNQEPQLPLLLVEEKRQGEPASISHSENGEREEMAPLPELIAAPAVGHLMEVAALDKSGQGETREKESAPAEADDFYLQTSQEVDAIMRAASDGRTGDHWHTDEQSLVRAHQIPGARHRVQLELSSSEIAAGARMEILENLTFAQDPDFNFALLYISRLLAPPSPLGPKARASDWIDLDDVMDKIGWDPRSSAARAAMREKVWRYILFGTRARIVGQRSGRYVDRRSGETIETVISSAPWAILEEEKPVEPSLFPEMGAAPLRVELVASRAWTRLTTLPETAQYLPMGELLGAIPGAKPSGAWARVIGLALANFWRRHSQSASEGGILPTRAELLDRYKPSIAPVTQVLEGNDPRRAVEYWAGALQILVSCQFLAKEGEATLTLAQMREKLPRKKWQREWLDGRVELRPGTKMRAPIQNVASSLPPPRPVNLKRKRGRPRKAEPS